mgnify:CR=1 FL=1
MQIELRSEEAARAFREMSDEIKSKLRVTEVSFGDDPSTMQIVATAVGPVVSTAHTDMDSRPRSPAALKLRSCAHTQCKRLKSTMCLQEVCPRT